MTALGTWNLTMSTPMGEQKTTLVVTEDGATMLNPDGDQEAVNEFVRDGDAMKWKVAIKKPIPLTLHFDVAVDGDALTGKFRPGMFPPSPVTGVRA